MSDKMTRAMLALESTQLQVSYAALTFINMVEEEDIVLDPTGIVMTREFKELRDAVKRWRESGEALYQAIKEAP